MANAELDLRVESSHALENRRQEEIVQERLGRGFAYPIYSPTPLRWRVQVDLRRERSQSEKPALFEMSEPQFDAALGVAQLRILLHPDRIEEEGEMMRTWFKAADYPEGLPMDEGDSAEIIGFYTKMVMLWYEIKQTSRRDLLFMDERLSDFEVKPGVDRLCGYCAEYYIQRVLLPRSSEPSSGKYD